MQQKIMLASMNSIKEELLSRPLPKARKAGGTRWQQIFWMVAVIKIKCKKADRYKYVNANSQHL
jgi:hypothetical protein